MFLSQGDVRARNLLITDVEPGPDLIDMRVLGTSLPEEALQLEGTRGAVVLSLFLLLLQGQPLGRGVGILEACLCIS